ncbi:MAG: DM13 domain-containing protein [Chloroflexi bacterium]|nr:DM13 domain-containing protein [Chloroflexota bacterium]
MRRAIPVLLCLGAALATLAACGGSPTPAPATATPVVIATPTNPPPPPPPPTPKGPFLPVGQAAELQGQAHGVAGRAQVIGDRELLVQGFSYDGQGREADLRLTPMGQPDQPLAILLELEGPYQAQALMLTVPPELDPASGEVEIVVYSRADSAAYGRGAFGAAAPQTPTPPPATPTSAAGDSPLATPAP